MDDPKEILVSMVVPVYNVEDYLQECIDSICAQTHHNLEIILVNDGSTDSSGEICDRAAERDARIRVFHNPNGGVSAARNTGLDQANGEYICFSDSDDVCAPFFVEHMLQACLQERADIAVGNYEEYEDTIVFSPASDVKAQVYSGRDAVRHLIGKEHIKYTVVYDKLYKSELFQNIRFPEGLIHEDEDFSYRILYEAEKVVDLQETIYGYRTRSGSITTSDYSEKRTAVLDIAQKRVEFFQERNEAPLKDAFQWVYALLLLQHYPRIKKDLHRPKQAKKMKQEFRKLAPELLRSPYLSRKKKCVIAVFRFFPGQYAWAMDAKEKLSKMIGM